MSRVQSVKPKPSVRPTASLSNPFANTSNSLRSTSRGAEGDPLLGGKIPNSRKSCAAPVNKCSLY